MHYTSLDRDTLIAWYLCEFYPIYSRARVCVVRKNASIFISGSFVWQLKPIFIIHSCNDWLAKRQIKIIIHKKFNSICSRNRISERWKRQRTKKQYDARESVTLIFICCEYRNAISIAANLFFMTLTGCAKCDWTGVPSESIPSEKEIGCHTQTKMKADVDAQYAWVEMMMLILQTNVQRIGFSFLWRKKVHTFKLLWIIRK